MLSKSLDNAKSSGSSMVSMMNQSLEQSVNPSVGSNIDLRV
ncbi:MAG: putative motility protein [Butyrivibrio sp.]|nr:putative motility protein [Butyrivibrio sp.]